MRAPRKWGRRAVSSILGGAIFISILLVGFGLIFWNGTLYDNYIQAINSRELLYQQRVSENVVVSGFKFSNGKLNLTIANFGPQMVNIIRIWVTDLSLQTPTHQRYDVNYFVNPSKSITNIGQNLNIPSAGHLYTVKFMTGRGNIFAATNFQQNAVVGIAQGMGWITIDWDSYLFTDNSIYPTWKPGWNIAGAGNVIEFQINATNHWDRDLTVLKYTYLRLEIDTGSTGNAKAYYIMAPGARPTVTNNYCYTGPDTPIVIPYNQTGDYPTGGKPTVLQFMDATYFSGGSCNIPSNKPQHGYFSVYLVIYYSWLDSTGVTHVSAQTIPFEATGFP